MTIRKEKFGKRPFTQFEKERCDQMLDRAFGPGFSARNPQYTFAHLQRRNTDDGTLAQFVDLVPESLTKKARKLTQG